MSDQEPVPEPEGEAPTGGSRAKIPLIAALVVGLAVGAGTGAKVIGPLVAKKMGFATHSVSADSTGKDGEHGDSASSEEGGKGGGKAGDAAAPPVLLLENLVLNPANSGGSRYLLLSMAIESVDAKSVAALGLRDAELKDLVLTTLSKKTVDELSDVAGRENIKLELIAAVKERFGKNSVKQLYFPQFVIQ